MRNFLFFLALIPSIVSSQVTLKFSASGGASVLTHRANLETTTYSDLYRFSAISFGGTNQFTFEDFKREYNITTDVYQPRIGARLSAQKDNYPFLLTAEITTSPSTIVAPRVGAEFGFSDKFYISERGYVNFFSGYKFVKDWGWGTQTLLNSMHNRKARALAREWFVTSDDLGINYAHMIRISSAIGYNILERYAIQLEPYYEVDISSYRKKPARMTNLGVNLLIVCEL